jgi:hypothetical protein
MKPRKTPPSSFFKKSAETTFGPELLKHTSTGFFRLIHDDGAWISAFRRMIDVG